MEYAWVRNVALEVASTLCGTAGKQLMRIGKLVELSASGEDGPHSRGTASRCQGGRKRRHHGESNSKWAKEYDHEDGHEYKELSDEDDDYTSTDREETPRQEEKRSLLPRKKGGRRRSSSCNKTSASESEHEGRALENEQEGKVGFPLERYENKQEEKNAEFSTSGSSLGGQIVGEQVKHAADLVMLQHANRSSDAADVQNTGCDSVVVIIPPVLTAVSGVSSRCFSSPDESESRPTRASTFSFAPRRSGRSVSDNGDGDERGIKHCHVAGDACSKDEKGKGLEEEPLRIFMQSDIDENNALALVPRTRTLKLHQQQKPRKLSCFQSEKNILSSSSKDSSSSFDVERWRLGRGLCVSGIFINAFIGPFLDAFAYKGVAQSLITPLSGLGVVWNTILAPFTLGEHLSCGRIAGILCILVGIISTVSFAVKQEDDEWNKRKIEFIWFSLRTQCYVFFFMLFVFGNLVLQHRLPKHDFRRGFSIGITAGGMSGNMFCMKLLMQLLGLGHTDGGFRGIFLLFWTDTFLLCSILGGALFFSITNAALLATGMRNFDSLYMVSIFEASQIIVDGLSAAVVMRDFDRPPELWLPGNYLLAPVWRIIGYAGSIFLIVVGLGVLLQAQKKTAVSGRYGAS